MSSELRNKLHLFVLQAGHSSLGCCVSPFVEFASTLMRPMRAETATCKQGYHNALHNPGCSAWLLVRSRDFISGLSDASEYLEISHESDPKEMGHAPGSL